MRLGFTGTQHGMTCVQMTRVENLVEELFPLVAAHGDCIGADEDFHRICRRTNSAMWVIGHPPLKEGKRAWCNFDEVREPKDYLERNHCIVNECDMLIAAPRTHQEELRSGTWSTIRSAWKSGKHVIIVYPDGSFSETNKGDGIL